MLELRQIKKEHNSSTVVDSLSLSVKAGEIAVLLGHSGVGKSTLLRIISGLDKADAGDMLIKGTPLNQTREEQAVGMVFQEYHLFSHITAQENIELPLLHVLNYSPEEAAEQAKQLLKDYQLYDQAHHIPYQLSGGQKQRLAIARAASLNPSILCMDEPTAALDPRQTDKVIKTIQQLQESGKVTLIATHDTATLPLLDCTIHLIEAGQIAETASSAAFFANRVSYPKIDAYLKGER